MNISPVNFKGTFCLNQRDLGNKKFNKVLSKKEELGMSFEVSCYTNPDKLYVHVPHKSDFDLIKLLKKLSVKYLRIDEADSLNPDDIVARMIICSNGNLNGKFLQKVDTKKLDTELRKNPEMYVGYNGANGSGLKYDRFKNFLKTNQEIRSPIIYLRRLSNGEIETHVYDGRHRFAVLRDMGIKQIPVTIDEDSLKLAREIGLV